jgi:hypothetical protein
LERLKELGYDASVVNEELPKDGIFQFMGEEK